MAFKLIPRCLSNKIDTSLRSNEKPSRQNFTHCFHLWFVFVCSITHYGKCPCMCKLSPITLITKGVNCAPCKLIFAILHYYNYEDTNKNLPKHHQIYEKYLSIHICLCFLEYCQQTVSVLLEDQHHQWENGDHKSWKDNHDHHQEILWTVNNAEYIKPSHRLRLSHIPNPMTYM